ncbi:flagellar hook-length control protein FliK [Alteromonas aestuariivivens]|uniref:Flagellar hook-length control protein FliK n=1 Tax=Alteromonas aestuariivivens TaxID=1938339 RepID=A0A3D8M421_9ALTE|nr:flagellar hook-length control protein FliK [Alteromonas aestuariivivens]RDV24358.1 flagellar hook-length control protein FliK [Alteromonas aestuariivivens]
MKLNIPVLQSLFSAPSSAEALPLNSPLGKELQALTPVVLNKLPKEILQLIVSPANEKVWYIQQPAGLNLSARGRYFLAGTGENSKAILLSANQAQTAAKLSQQQMTSLMKLLTQYYSNGANLSTFSATGKILAIKGSQLEIGFEQQKPVQFPLPAQAKPSRLKAGSPVNLTLQSKPSASWALELNQSPKQTNASEAMRLQVPNRHPLVHCILKQKLDSGLVLPHRQGQALASALHPIAPNMPKAEPNSISEWQLSSNKNVLKIKQVSATPLAQLQLPQALQGNVAKLGSQQSIKLANLGSVQNLPELLLSESLKQVLAEPTRITTDIGKRSATTSPVQNVDAQRVLMQQFKVLSNTLLAETGSPRQALQQLLNGLSHPEHLPSAESRLLAQNIATSLKSGFSEQATENSGLAETKPEGKIYRQVKHSEYSQQLSTSVQSLLSAPTLPITAHALQNPANSSAFLSGLLTLLQVTLSGRALKHASPNPARLQQYESSLNTLIGEMALVPEPKRAQVAREFSQMDQKLNILKDLKTLLANHQQHKLAQAESRLQGQENFYYVLPIAQGNQTPPELLIRRDSSPNNSAQRETTGQSNWHLTMKLDVAELGQMLAKTRISGEKIDLNLYTSTDALLTRVSDTLPLLTRRLSALGLEVTSTSCQRGRIPPSLQDKPYQLFEAQA